MDQLRDADNAHKAEPLNRLRALPCSAPDVCSTRDACADAYSHHVRGIELGFKIRAALADGGDASPDDPTLQQQLLEMNLEIEEGKERMALCAQRMVELRIRRKP